MAAKNDLQACGGTGDGDTIDEQSMVLGKFLGQVDELTWKKLINYECHWNWVQKDFNEAEAQLILDRTGSYEQKPSSEAEHRFYLKSSVEARYHEHNCEDDVQSNIRSAANKSFLLIYLGKFKEAQVLLDQIKNDLALALALEKGDKHEKNKSVQCGSGDDGLSKSTANNDVEDTFSNPEVLLGFNYILDGLTAYYYLANNGCCVNTRLLVSLDYEGFPLKTKEVILRFKLRSFGGTRKCFELIKNVYKELMVVDPQTPAWVAGYYYYTRALRRQASLKSGPTEEETHAALAFHKLNPTFPLSVSNVCTNMSEIVRTNWELECFWPFQYGDQIFESPNDMCKEIHNKAKELLRPINSGKLKALVIDLNSIEVYLEISAIYSSSLPYLYQDLDLALKYVDIALSIKPNDTVAQHRKALILLKQAVHSSDPVKSNELRSEVEMLLRNSSGPSSTTNLAFYALYDLFNFLLGDIKKNGVELQESLAKHIQLTERWNSTEISKLYFLQGCFKFMTENRRDAFNDWIQAFLLDSSTDHFGNMNMSVSRFAWDQKLIRIKKVREMLQALGAEIHSETENAKIVEIMTKQVDEIIAYHENHAKKFDKKKWNGENTWVVVSGSSSSPRRSRCVSEGEALSVNQTRSRSFYNVNRKQDQDKHKHMSPNGSLAGEERGFGRYRQQQQKCQNSHTRSRSSQSESMADMDDNWRSGSRLQ